MGLRNRKKRVIKHQSPFTNHAFMYKTDFRTVSFPYRLFSGKNALDKLPDEAGRLKAKRAFILSGRTVSRKTLLVSHLRELLGASCVGSFDEMDKDTSRSSTVRAVEAA